MIRETRKQDKEKEKRRKKKKKPHYPSIKNLVYAPRTNPLFSLRCCNLLLSAVIHPGTTKLVATSTAITVTTSIVASRIGTAVCSVLASVIICATIGTLAPRKW
jgi:hypothetical protein